MMNGRSLPIETRDYRAIADCYCSDVQDGVILASKWIRLATRRYLDHPDSIFDEAGGRACRFIEKLPHVKGRWAARHERFHLQPWQVWIIFSLFGTLDPDGLRQFRQAYICVPRKNGKSPLAAGIGLYMLCADNEAGAEVYCGANTQYQAWEVFRPAKLMVDRTPALQHNLGLKVHAKAIRHPASGSRFEAVIGKPGDGAAPSCGICDEYHEASDSVLYDAFQTGMVGREQPLLLTITTAGTDLSSPCRDLQVQAQGVLEGTFHDSALFAAIYGIDEGDDWTGEATLVKANPNFGISIDPRALKHDQAIAIQNASKANTFKTKHLDIWCNASTAWMNMERWNAGADRTLKEEDFRSDECFAGVDLSSKIDIAVSLKLFRRWVGEKEHYYVFPRFYLPAERVESPECKHYQRWVKEGFLVATEGNVIDYSKIRDDLKSDISHFNIIECGFDPYNATHLMQELEKYGLTPVEIPQTVKCLSEPMKELEAATLDGRMHHDGNPIMTWCISNVVAHLDANDNVFPRKDRPENKIDGAVALIIALARALAQTDPIEPRIYIL